MLPPLRGSFFHPHPGAAHDTGICLVIERDPFTLAKEVASLDSLSGGRFIFGIGGGWNRELRQDLVVAEARAEAAPADLARKARRVLDRFAKIKY